MDKDLLYRKYSHIIPGSIEEIARGQTIICGKSDKITSHGTICVIKCSDSEFSSICLKTRIINIQDIGQVKRCKPCTKAARNLRRRVAFDR